MIKTICIDDINKIKIGDVLVPSLDEFYQHWTVGEIDKFLCTYRFYYYSSYKRELCNRTIKKIGCTCKYETESPKESSWYPIINNSFPYKLFNDIEVITLKSKPRLKFLE